MVKISPSVLSADFAYLADDLAATKAAGADMLHVDIMDGVYVPNMSLGVPVVKAMRRVCDLFFDVHLMTALPSQLIDLYADAGADLITIHVETEPEKTADILRHIKEKGCKAGLALDPDTPIEQVLQYLPLLDLALVMTVKSGFGGQKFRPELLSKVTAVYEEAKRQGRDDLTIQVDGGINPETIALASAAGANCFVAGSAVYNMPDYKEAISALRTAAESAARA